MYKTGYIFNRKIIICKMIYKASLSMKHAPAGFLAISGPRLVWRCYRLSIARTECAPPRNACALTMAHTAVFGSWWWRSWMPTFPCWCGPKIHILTCDLIRNTWTFLYNDMMMINKSEATGYELSLSLNLRYGTMTFS